MMAAAALSVVAAAQNSKLQSSSAKTGPDPMLSATKPITPKSAMPVHRKSAIALPATAGKNTTAELTHLENQKIRSGSTTNENKGPGKSVTGTKPVENSAASGPAINYKYQKPAGGKQATVPDANTRNSSNRVKKN